MIALAGAIRLAAGQQESEAILVRPRWELEGLVAVG
jgi:N6-L-threonylcarbamoyladenine synthase